MFQKCQVCIILTFKAFPIKSICFTIQGLNTHIHPWTHPNLTNIHIHHCYALRNLLKLCWDNSGQKRYNRDTNRHPATSQTPKKAVWGCVAVQVDIKWWLLLSFGAWWCLLVSQVVWRSGEGVWGVSQRVSECCLWTRVRFGASEGVSECSGLVLYSKCSLLEKLWKSKFHSLDTFETSKYQNRPIKAP